MVGDNNGGKYILYSIYSSMLFIDLFIYTIKACGKTHEGPHNISIHLRGPRPRIRTRARPIILLLSFLYERMVISFVVLQHRYERGCTS